MTKVYHCDRCGKNITALSTSGVPKQVRAHNRLIHGVSECSTARFLELRRRIDRSTDIEYPNLNINLLNYKSSVWFFCCMLFNYHSYSLYLDFKGI